MVKAKEKETQDESVAVDDGVRKGEGEVAEVGPVPASTEDAGLTAPIPLEAAASSPLCEQKTFWSPEYISAKTVEIIHAVRKWKTIHQARPTHVRELFLLCLESESLIIDALTGIDPTSLLIFTAALRQSGFEVQSLAYHQYQARCFGQRLPQLLRNDFLADYLDNVLDEPDFDSDSDSGSDVAVESCYPCLGISNISAEDRFYIHTEILHNIELDPSKPITFRSTNLQKALKAFFKVPDTIIERLRTPQICSMAINTEVALPLPVLPQGWAGEKDFKAIGSVSKATQRSIEPVGPHFLAHARRARHKRTFSEDDRIQAQESVKKVEDDDAGEISEPEDPSMLMRDAKDWKGQDHYAVLGLSKYRWKATEEQIKRAHRKKVLRHHPDKKAAAGSTEDDSFFKCIQKATEILLDPVKRRQFDSVDEAADVEPPTKKQTQKGNFYKLWNPVFKAESRFSRTQPVPKLGDEKSTKEEVESFYNFWYNFDSWRSFEYQDEDVPDDNENRDQKRHMERKNNNARKKKKTEDSARLRKLLDDCSGLDERIKKFRQEANASKNKKRLEKEAAEKKAAEEAKAKKEAEEKAAKEAEEAAKVEREQGKKAKEAAKNAVKKNKRVLKGSVKDANYFVKGSAPAAAIDAVLNDVELVQARVDPDEIAALASKLTGLKVADDIKSVWSDEVKRLVGIGKLNDGDAKTLVV